MSADEDPIAPWNNGDPVSRGLVGVEIDDDGVVTIELRQPPNNFLSVRLVGALADAVEFCDSVPAARAIVLCSQGKHFCAGAALDASPADDEPAAPQRHLYDEAVRLFRGQLPIVAATHGAVIGGGLGLALACDFRVCGPGTRFAANFGRLGFHHGFGLTVTMPRVVGQQQTLRLLLEAERIDGTEAARIGLADVVVPDEEIRQAAVDLARRIAGNAPLAVRSIRATLRGALADEVHRALVHERAEQERLAATGDFAEGVKAMTERRRPVFLGK
jgi:2-(1,2-epoxy-1,2-dihydrophenyl)acetyl-CoA isomerase